MKPYQLAMGAALLGAAGLALFGDKRPAADLAEASPRRAPTAIAMPAAAARVAPKTTAAAPILALRPRDELIGEDEFSSVGNGGVFLSQSWAAPAAPPAVVPAPPAVAPVAPALPFTYLGKALENGAWDVFLARSGQTYVVRLDSLIDGQYRIAAIAPPLMTLTYLPLNQAQQIDIGAAQ